VHKLSLFSALDIMGCASSTSASAAEPACKSTQQKEEAQPNKTLLQGGAVAESESMCKSCGNKGKDILGRRCACQYGQALVGPLAAVKVTIVSARSLRNADFVGKSDPYCECEIVGKPNSKFATAVIDDNLNPEWNHEAEITGYNVGDSLTFTVKDKDNDLIKSDDFLGRVTLTTAQFFEAGFEGELPLSCAGKGVEAFLKVKVQLVQPKVWLTIISARGLRNADFIGKSDPYCICDIPGRTDVSMMTQVIENNLNPEWNHEAEIMGYRVEDDLTFTVKDKDTLKSDDVLGMVTLTCEQFIEAGFEGELQLSNAGNTEAFLKVKIEIGEKVEPEPEQVEPAPILKPEPILETKSAPTGLCCRAPKGF